MKQRLIWSIVGIMALLSPISASASIIYDQPYPDGHIYTGLSCHLIATVTSPTSVPRWNAGWAQYTVLSSTTANSVEFIIGTSSTPCGGGILVLNPLNVPTVNDGEYHTYTEPFQPNIDCSGDACHIFTGETVYVWAAITSPLDFKSDALNLNFTGILTSSERPSNPSTHVISTVPANGSTIATSTSFVIGGTYNVNTDEWLQALAVNNANWFVQVTITPNSVVIGIPSAAGSFDAAFGTKILTFPIPTSGFSSFSTTTSITDVGKYNVTTQIIKPSPYNSFFTWLGFGSATVLDATSTSFTASYRTGFDQLTSSTTDIITDYFASSSPALIASCASFTGFNLGDCLNLLFIPQSGDLSRVINDLNSGLFLYAPWGYVTRVLTIFSGQATSSFPMIHTGIPDPTNPHQLMAFTYDPNEAIVGAAGLMDSIRDPVTDENPREALEIIVRSVIALTVMSITFYDLSGGKSRGKHREPKTRLS